MNVWIHLALIASILFPSDTVYVDVKQGTLRGKVVDFVEDKYANVSTKINVFQGIPYGEKPVRWRPPEMKKRWKGVRDATNFNFSCPQYVVPGQELSSTPLTMSEDCLLLNVYAPHETDENVPVMVFIHGGAFIEGTSMTYDFSGVPLAAIGNVVIVTINYRVGALGFLSTGDEAARGNFGLLDQALALQWVQDNIHAFGGDKTKVTIFGESAGAASVDLQVISKYSRDLFAQAISESGVASALWAISEEFENNKVNYSFRLGNQVNCATSNTTELVECLRKIDAVYLEMVSAKMSLTQDHPIRMGPTIDGVFLNGYPRAFLERGDFKDCPMIIGFNKDEGTFEVLQEMPSYYYSTEPPYINKADLNSILLKSLKIIYGSDNVEYEIEQEVLQQYVNLSYSDQEVHDYFETIVQIYGDAGFNCPSILTARAHANMTSLPVYMYYMTHAPKSSYFIINRTGPGWLGAGHGEDLPFVFGYPFIPELKGSRGQMTEEEAKLSVNFMHFWTNFAKTGDPSRKDLISPPGVGGMEWPAFTERELQYKKMSVELPVGRALKVKKCAFWDRIERTAQGV
ncbi:Carboxylesterase 4A [Holothuria leucospilota]|uniref:Carboxylic ester hydrolase n=1 Tax=Holothuria leucospilota TaxID=206669 RepID=A0A9Q1H844_HOLLE|nr:Carboxylesterase 4A [Holothuria leucospilota]